MEWLAYLVAALFVLLVAACVLLIILQAPGGWILLGLALLIEYLDRFYLPSGDRQTFAWWVLGACAGLLIVGEAIDLLAAAAGAKRGGASRRGMIGSLVGGILGAILLTGLIPIPVLGTLIGAMLGTFAGAVLGEMSGPEQVAVGETMRPALGASIGRAIGTATKLGIGITMWIVLSVAAFWP
ncbi:MAG: DUF456 family protein [Planctomycetota bacterium]|jgi:uncharacterized protein YqgC (DUF456 family)